MSKSLGFVYAQAALRTWQAPIWRIWLARIFGTRFESEDPCGTVTGYTWRGVMYLTDFKPKDKRYADQR